MKKIAASIMCADQLRLQEELDALKEAGIDWLHCDVMDGVFVNNLAMGPYVIKQLTEMKTFTVDIHLACVEPLKYVEMFAELDPDYLTFHVEVTDSPQKIIDRIHSKGLKAGIAVSPETPVSDLFPFLGSVDLILLMTVNPGFAGQTFYMPALEKLKALNHYLADQSHQPLIEVDGNIFKDTAEKIAPIGANLYVAGTSALFNSDSRSYQEKAAVLNGIIQ